MQAPGPLTLPCVERGEAGGVLEQDPGSRWSRPALEPVTDQMT